MMLSDWQPAFDGLPIGPVRHFQTIGSTNLEASNWAEAGAPDLALVLADAQTAGRGRQGRTWFSPQGAALAFSLILRPRPSELKTLDSTTYLARLTALGALAVAQVLRCRYGLLAEVKWPNDVLLDRRKVCGVLAEAHWTGSELGAVILGIGVNVTPASVPPSAETAFPATSVEDALGRPIWRAGLLRRILEQLLDLREDLATTEIWNAWDELLAFKGEWVSVVEGPAGSPMLGQEAMLLGLDSEGCLRLQARSGEVFTLRTGELRLLPVS